MIVCHCKGINDRAIREAVRSGARTCRQVARACQAGGRCGGCRPLIHEIIEGEGEDLVALEVGGPLPVAAS